MQNFFKRQYKKLKLLVLLTAVILFVANLFAGCDNSQSHQSISSISRKWLDIKKDFNSSADGLESRIDDFCLTLTGFFASPIGDLYQIHRPEGIQYLADVNSAADRLKTAVKNNDNQAFYLTAVEIDASLDLLQRIDNNLSDASQRDYFLLFFFFSVLVIAVILALIVQDARVDKAERREQQSLAFSRETIITQERERLRIARELHDTVAQDLWRLSFQTESIDKTDENTQRSKLCAEVVKGQKEVMQRVRTICDNLIPPDFQRRRFDDALHNLCYNFEQRTGIECQLVIQDNLLPGSLDGDIQLQSFRIVQECLTNIEKHAEASETSVIVRSVKEGELVICISDNGKGFSPPDRDSLRTLRSDGGHYGLWNIYERAASIQAEVTIDSEKGEGTMVTLKIPFTGLWKK
ncbi:sensor histidine kinase [Treponema sp. R80B11-R83G3]